MAGKAVSPGKPVRSGNLTASKLDRTRKRIGPLKVELFGVEIGRPGGERSVHRQVEDALLCAIASGRIREGARMPSLKSLASAANVNLNTVAKAFAGLRKLEVTRKGTLAGITVRPGGRGRASAVVDSRAREAMAYARSIQAAGGVTP